MINEDGTSPNIDINLRANNNIPMCNALLTVASSGGTSYLQCDRRARDHAGNVHACTIDGIVVTWWLENER